MVALSSIKTRIVTELSRSDLDTGGALAAQLLTHIQRACEYYADRRFWFNAIVTSVNTVASTATVTIPSTVRRVERVTIPTLGVELREVTLAGLDDGTETGIPETYAYYNDTLRMYPIPNAIYALRIAGVSQIAAPALDADDNEWTDEAQDLIVNHAKMTLCRDQFRDPEGVQLAMGAVTDHLNRLLRETARRLETPRRMEPRGVRYNINTG